VTYDLSGSDSAAGDLEIVHPQGPGYVCVKQIQTARPDACPSQAYFVNNDPSGGCCSE
jgi:hypothetical protein